MSEFTKEQLIERIETQKETALKHPECSIALMDLQIAEMALASLTAEPVAWSTDSSLIVNSRVITIYKSVADSWIEKGMRVVPLYAATPAPDYR